MPVPKGYLALTSGENRLVRPVDHRTTFADPAHALSYYASTGVLSKVAHGYYLVVPEEQRGGSWKPELEAVALGMAVTVFGVDGAALTGVSAARALGAIPRALAAATVAVSRQRHTVMTSLGEVRFQKREVQKLDLQRAVTEIVTGWTTTPEQTVLDLAHKPNGGIVTVATVGEAIRALLPRCDLDLVGQLAVRQRRAVAWQRLAWLAGRPVPATGRRGVSTGGLTGGPGDPAEYGLVAVP